jgi:hypothetical protein
MRITNLSMPNPSAQMHKGNFLLPHNVKAGDTVEILVTMPHGPFVGVIHFKVEEDE